VRDAKINMLVYTLLSVLVVFGMVNWADAVIDEGSLVGVWLFDENEGEIAHDSSDNGNDAEFQGAPQWVDGKFGKALWFNGSTDYVAAPDSESLDINGDQLSIVAWINGEDWPAANHVVRKVADGDTSAIYILRVQPDTVRIYLNTGGGDEITDGVTVLPVDEWTHVAMVYDGAEVQVYVNGELDGSKPQSGEVRQSDNELRIGRGEPAGYFMGIIDEVAVFASALTEEDIREIMEVGLNELILPVEFSGKLPTVWAEVKTAY
jgi:PKD repeat protein